MRQKRRPEAGSPPSITMWKAPSTKDSLHERVAGSGSRAVRGPSSTRGACSSPAARAAGESRTCPNSCSVSKGSHRSASLKHARDDHDCSVPSATVRVLQTWCLHAQPTG